MTPHATAGGTATATDDETAMVLMVSTMLRRGLVTMLKALGNVAALR